MESEISDVNRGAAPTDRRRRRTSPTRPADSLRPLNLPTAGSAVYDILRGQILSGHLRPGDRLDLLFLEQTLAVSRSPLKDALSRLAGEGLIEIRPRQGTFVAPMTERRLRENFEVRAYLERAVAEDAVARGSDADIAAIQAVFAGMTALLDQPHGLDQMGAYLERDHVFHGRIIALADNSQLTELYEQVNTHLLIGRITSFYTPIDVQLTHQEHQAIVAALVARDGVQLRRALDRHVTRSGQAALLHLAQQREQLAGVDRDHAATEAGS